MMNGNGNPTPSPPPGTQSTVYDGRTEVAVTLPVVTWNSILTVIADAPWKIADPLMTEIRRQITATLEPARAIAGCAGRPAAMTDVSAFPGGLPTDYRVHLEWVRHSAEGATIDAFDLTWAPYGDRIRETLVPFYIADDGSGLLTLTDAGMAELTENWAAKADTSFANVTVAGTLAVQGDATFACQ